MDENKEPIWAASCMECGFDKSYTEEENTPESCPKCGEHKNFDIVHLPSLFD